MDVTQTRTALDAILARARLQVSPSDYDRLLGLYPLLQAQTASLRIPELPDLEPALIFPAFTARE